MQMEADRDSTTLLKIQKLIRVIRDYDPRMTLGHLNMLLLVALNEGATTAELVTKSRYGHTRGGRYLLDLSLKLRSGEEGFKLISREDDAVDLRITRYSLSREGKGLIAQIEQAMTK